jgi:hypothetical protein
MQQPPLVILLDIDGTVIGDITPQVMIYDLVNRMKSHSRTPSAKGVTCPSFPVKEVREKLQDGIVRPHFHTFITEMTKRGIELFVYTASEKKWAEFIVKQIEAAFDFKFNRPLFTRDQCHVVNGEWTKRISTVLPSIVRTLNKKHSVKFKVKDVVDNIIAIDNNRVYSRQDSDRLLLCPTYKYTSPENIAYVINKRSYDAYAPAIHQSINAYMDNYKPFKNFMRFERQFYQMYVNALTESISLRETCLHDTLFKIITMCIVHKNIQEFNSHTIRYIQNKIV